MKEFRKRYWHELVLCASSLSLIYSPFAYTIENPELLIAASGEINSKATQDIYTINFNNVSIIELIRFTSKISGLNFVFEEADLQFSVSVISEEPVSAQSMLAALSQVLRMHDLTLLEQGSNVLITKSKKINQIPKIVASDLHESAPSHSALITRVFRIKNANVNSIANILKPMISDTALIEVSSETRQLIVTDITTNIEQIAALLTTLDSPHTPLEVDVYAVKNVPAATLISLTEQILAPFKEDNPLILVSQLDTNSIYVVSTSYLVERAVSLLEDLDVPFSDSVVGAGKPSNEKPSFLVYQPKSLSGKALEKELQDLASNLSQSGLTDPNFLTTLHSMRWMSSTNSLIFTGDSQSIQKVKTVLEIMDVSSSEEKLKSERSSFFVYHPLHRPGEELEQELHNLANNLSDSNLSDPTFLNTLNSMKWVPSTDSLIFTGNTESIDKVKALLQTMDVASARGMMSKGFFLYKLQHVPCQTMLSQLKRIADKLPSSSYQNQSLISSVESIECIPSSNSLLILGTSNAIEQVKTIIEEFDTKEQASILSDNASFLVYRPKYLSAKEIQIALHALISPSNESGLNDPQLIKAVQSMRYVEQTNSIVFVGSQPSLDQIQQMLKTIDTSATLDTVEEFESTTFLLYKAEYLPGNQLLEALKRFALQLDQSNISNKELIVSIHAAKWIRDNNTILFTGSKRTLEQIDHLVKKFDIPTPGTSAEELAAAQRQASDFVVYSPHYLTGPELIAVLQDFMRGLQQSGVSDSPLYDAISNLKWMDKTSSLLISGNPEAIAQVEQLLAKFDVPQKGSTLSTIESIDNTSFLVYKLQYHPGNDIQLALKQVAASLSQSGASSKELISAIDSLQWVQITNSILCSGHQDVLVRLKELIQNLDVPLRQVFIEVLIVQTTLQNQQNFGLQWGGQIKYLNKTVMQSGNFPVNTSSTGTGTWPSTSFPSQLQNINGSTFPTNSSILFPNSGFDLGVIGDIVMHKGKSFISLGSLVNALQEDADSTIILNPKIITQDNRQSTVFVGQNVPYTGSLVTNTVQTGTVQNANIEYRDVGVSLTITPLLGEEDIITMDIVQDISQLLQSDNVVTSSQYLTGIQTNHSHMETRVHVPNNHFVALSGMINDTKTHYKTGIPCLGGLPVIGMFFSENDRQAQKNNIIIFVRPQIVTTYQEYKAITEHQEWLFKDNARLPSLKEEFDAGIDLVKTPENE